MASPCLWLDKTFTHLRLCTLLIPGSPSVAFMLTLLTLYSLDFFEDVLAVKLTTEALLFLKFARGFRDNCCSGCS